jgi:hypothetical protein
MTETMNQFYGWIDGFLIVFYRFTDIPILDYMIGTFCLSMMAVLIGEVTVSLALKVNRPYLDELSGRMSRKEKLSIEAYEQGNVAGYQALNKEATDAWGKKFFAMMAHSAAILWPIPFALGWMQTRFQDVDFAISFPFTLITDSVGYTFSFFPIYVLSRIVFGHLRPYLPYFSSVHRELVKAASDPGPS